MRSLLVLVNPTASGGRGGRHLPTLTAELDRLRAPHRIVQTRSADHARAAAAGAVEGGETVVAVGGDGMLRPLARALVGTGTPLALVPTGRGNDLARVLGIPADAAAAGRLAATGDTRPIDVGFVDDVPFLGIASVGFDSDANAIANAARLVRGKPVYLYAALRALVGWRDAEFTISLDGNVWRLSGYSVAVANSTTYGGGMRIAPTARLDDGMLDVVATGATPKLRFLRSLPKVFRGTHVREPSVTTLRGAVVELDADRPFELYADGDPIGRLPTRITIRPRCLNVVVPS